MKVSKEELKEIIIEEVTKEVRSKPHGTFERRDTDALQELRKMVEAAVKKALKNLGFPSGEEYIPPPYSDDPPENLSVSRDIPVTHGRSYKSE